MAPRLPIDITSVNRRVRQAENTADAAQTTADLKEQYTDREIANPGWIVLDPSGLIIEWGFTAVSGGAGIANVTYQKLTLGHFPYSWVGSCSVAGALATNTSYTCHITSITITGGNVTHQISVRKQVNGTTTICPDGEVTVQWIAIGY